ncbi:MAG: phosphodiester glycosidase family protein [Gammaproteobacteria bacterium]|nr:phosphodiester glycosidase family protein [Gammaproteobacteria bacterium]
MRSIITIVVVIYLSLTLPAWSQQPIKIERFTRDGPMVGVLATINLANPQVKIKVALADNRDPDGDGPCAGQLDVPSHVARKQDFAVTLNASFFGAPTVKVVDGQKVPYFVGNCTTLSGWHFSEGKLFGKPTTEKLRATMLIMEDGSVTLQDNVRELPAKTRFAVSGNAMVLVDGNNVATDKDGIRHPRSVVGLSQDGKTLYLVAIDGRQPSFSRGANMFELGETLKAMGAHTAINLDGGGSTAMIVKDSRTGTFGIANQPSEVSTDGYNVRMERPVADVIGVVIAPAVVEEKRNKN